MSKKNKGGKTPSAKAARNLEALKKAKENIAKETVETKETTVEKPIEEKKEEAKPEPKPTPAPKKTAYESYLEYKKHPHMGILSQKVEKNDKNVEIITIEFKNHETNEVVSTSFSTSFVKKGDGIDLPKLREQAEKGLKQYYAEHTKPAPKEEPKPEPKPEPKKEEKKSTSKKKEKVIEPEVVDAEVIKEEKKALVKSNPIVDTNDRIDANHGIELMKSFENRAAELEKGSELQKAMREHADVMLFVYGKKWLDQCIADGDDAFIKVSKQMYERLNSIGQNLLGITVKALPVVSKTGEKQMEIDFKETIESAPTETKEVLDKDAKKADAKDKLPEPNDKATDEEKYNALDSILRMKNTIGGNLHNAVQFAKNAFPELKDAEPAQVVALMYSKVQTTALTSMKNAMFGSLCNNGTIFYPHALMKKWLTPYQYDDKQIANIVKVILANKFNDLGNYATNTQSYGKLLKQMNDDLINRIIAAKTAQDESKLKISGKYDNLTVPAYIPAIKLMEHIRKCYGEDASPKLLKKQMQTVMGFYSDGIKPLAVYVEKSAYAKK